jgi:3-methyladenine DNA glycosylase AlkC
LAVVFDDQWEDRALKERMRHITLTMHDALPQAFPTALDILRRAAPDLSDYGFQNMVFSDFVELYGLDKWELSIPALEQFTRLVSAEFAVRPFIVKDQDRMMAQMLLWANDEDDRLRRLATEGCRPRLPWGIALQALKADPSPIMPILEQLKNDPSEAVRRSVANNLNDISKDNPDVVVEILRHWQKEDSPEMDRIISHALRTMVKQGDPDALELLGYPTNPAIKVKNLTLEPASVPIGEKLIISFEIESLAQTAQKLMIDYVVHLVRANGRLTPKVFKLRKKTLAPGETIRIVKNHSFAPVTTRKYYPGQHAIEIQVNGRLSERGDFELA